MHVHSYVSLSYGMLPSENCLHWRQRSSEQQFPFFEIREKGKWKKYIPVSEKASYWQPCHFFRISYWISFFLAEHYWNCRMLFFTVSSFCLLQDPQGKIHACLMQWVGWKKKWVFMNLCACPSHEDEEKRSTHTCTPSCWPGQQHTQAWSAQARRDIFIGSWNVLYDKSANVHSVLLALLFSSPLPCFQPVMFKKGKARFLRKSP